MSKLKIDYRTYDSYLVSTILEEPAENRNDCEGKYFKEFFWLKFVSEDLNI